MEFNDLLNENGIAPEVVLVLRHRPKERKLRERLPWLADQQPEVFNAYQQTQPKRVENQMLKSEYVAAFIGDQAARAVFVGLYENVGHHTCNRASRQRNPAQRELAKYDLPNGPGTCIWFDLKASKVLSRWKGKLIIRWPTPEIVWSRWADKNQFEVLAIKEESLFAPPMPDWRLLTFDWNDLHIIPPSWRAALKQWRGIYYILDISDGKGYVGAAYGRDNILGRWLNYSKKGHGNNELLKKRKPENFKFSILELMGPDAPQDLVCKHETSWKERLHTREFGLNKN